jgi:hypothetical protein
MGLGGRHVPLLVEQTAEVEVSIGMLGVELQGLPIGSQCLLRSHRFLLETEDEPIIGQRFGGRLMLLGGTLPGKKAAPRGLPPGQRHHLPPQF